jgi:SAM-dependent methyltransferase
MNTAELEQRLIASITQRYQSHSTKNLRDYIFSNHLFHSFDPAFIEFVYTFRHEISRYLSSKHHLAGLIEYCLHATKGYTYQRNQFINPTKAYDELLYSEYEDFFKQIRALLDTIDSVNALTRSFGAVLSRHHERLRLILASQCVAYQEHGLEENPLLQIVPCEEYSARFQLRILNINLAQLTEPVLDIGCGSAGALVNFLRNKGYTAFGVDRLAPAGPHFFEQDWFDFDYSSQAWGAIMAHQSLSTHFIYHHLHSSTNARRYAKLFLTIISSLQPGGVFCYAPGLPFFEGHLAELEHYSISKTTISTNTLLGIGEIAYSIQIKKEKETQKHHAHHRK